METWGFLILIRRFKELTLFEMSSQDRRVQVIPFRRDDTISRADVHFHIRLQGVFLAKLRIWMLLRDCLSCHELLPFGKEMILGLDFKAHFGWVTMSPADFTLKPFPLYRMVKKKEFTLVHYLLI